MMPVLMADNLTTVMYRLSRNSGSLNLLEPSGHLEACTGIPLILLQARPQGSVYLYIASSGVFCVPKNGENSPYKNGFSETSFSRYDPLDKGAIKHFPSHVFQQVVSRGSNAV
jgi:hypothetical protein